MQKSHKERIAIYFDPKLCACLRKAVGEAFNRGGPRLGIEPRNMIIPGRRRTRNMRKATSGVAIARVTPESCVVKGPRHGRRLFNTGIERPCCCLSEGMTDRVEKSKDVRR